MVIKHIALYSFTLRDSSGHQLSSTTAPIILSMRSGCGVSKINPPENPVSHRRSGGGSERTKGCQPIPIRRLFFVVSLRNVADFRNESTNVRVCALPLSNPQPYRLDEGALLATLSRRNGTWDAAKDRLGDGRLEKSLWLGCVWKVADCGCKSVNQPWS